MKVFGVIGSCRGKARLVQALVQHLTRHGLSVSTIKRVSDDVDLDRPGTDTYYQRQAGSRQIMIANSFRWALMYERTDGFDEPDVEPLIARLDPVDLVLLEGFRLAPVPKIEIVNPAADRRCQYLDDPSVIALACDGLPDPTRECFALDDIAAIAHFIEHHAIRVGGQYHVEPQRVRS